jgi:hypothetical protein
LRLIRKRDLVEQLRDVVGGAKEDDTTTLAGAMQQAANSYGDFKETLGNVTGLRDAFIGIAKSFKDIADTMNSIGDEKLGFLGKSFLGAKR